MVEGEVGLEVGLFGAPDSVSDPVSVGVPVPGAPVMIGMGKSTAVPFSASPFSD